MQTKKRKFGLTVDRHWDAPKLTDEERRTRECGTKELRTERDAKTQAQLRNMRAYKCSYCDYWHIGHRW